MDAKNFKNALLINYGVNLNVPLDKRKMGLEQRNRCPPKT